MEPPDLQSFMAAIRAGVSENEEFREAQVLCEPGRALVAESESLITKVLLRKNNVLYINDGGYGVLFDACHFKFRYPTRAYSLGNQKSFSGDAQEFAFYGACDSIDFMKGPFVSSQQY